MQEKLTIIDSRRVCERKTLQTIDVINVEMKIKKTLKKRKNVEKIKKNVCKRWIKTLPTFAMNPTTGKSSGCN